MIQTLLNRLINIHSNSWYERANTNEFPYVVFDILPLSSMEKDRQDNILEIDVYDHTTDPTNLEELTTMIDQSLKGFKFSDDSRGFWLQRIYKGNIPDPDQNIRRRQLRYQIKRYEVE